MHNTSHLLQLPVYSVDDDQVPDPYPDPNVAAAIEAACERAGGAVAWALLPTGKRAHLIYAELRTIDLAGGVGVLRDAAD